MDPKAGDRVKVITEDEQLEGILMPRPEILEEGFIVIKLDNGYNIGIEKKKVKKIELIDEYKKQKSEKKELKFNKSLPTVSVLSAGGTISSKIDYKTGGVYADYTAEDFVEMIPELENIANIKAKKIMSMMSEDISYREWSKIAEEIAKELNSDASGVVLAMGTDTLHYAAAALSFFLKPSKPVVITAAQRSIDRGSSDAFMNLSCAITAAAKSDIAEVTTCLHGTINDDYCLLIRGTKVRKMHTSRRDAFRPVNEEPIAKVFENGKIEITNKNYKKKSNEKTIVDDKFEEKTALIYIYPGMEPEVIDFYLSKGYKGIVLAATALGHVPTEASKSNLLPHIKKAIDRNIPVVIATQTLYGRVHPYVYTNLRKLSIQLSCIFAEDMLPEVAYIKLGWVLAHTKNMEEIKKLMLTNVAGEITERSSTGFLL
ncbi:MAG: Glu-tRNA(Gln) amidotransferase subunit GatD [Candidatus Woesearchaeota archaeon]|nr:Glu-tRNA(Gln) amidotransferase subunit GatD [Candidatus Woesearchaeota archaeon]